MNSIELGNAVDVALLDVAAAKDRLVPESLCAGGLTVIGGLFAITEWPHAAVACAIVAAVEGIAALRSWRRLRAAKRDLVRAQNAVRAFERAEWIALCDRLNRDRRAFSRSGAYEAPSPKDAA